MKFILHKCFFWMKSPGVFWNTKFALLKERGVILGSMPGLRPPEMVLGIVVRKRQKIAGDDESTLALGKIIQSNSKSKTVAPQNGPSSNKNPLKNSRKEYSHFPARSIVNFSW